MNGEKKRPEHTRKKFSLVKIPATEKNPKVLFLSVITKLDG
jgi:hypothetical protein